MTNKPVRSLSDFLVFGSPSIGIKPGDEVTTTAMTFCSTVNAIIHAGAIPVLVDVDPVTMNIDTDQPALAISPRNRRPRGVFEQTR